MKKILFLFCLTVLFAQTLHAQAKPIRHPSGHIIAFECSEGHIKNVNLQPNIIVQDTLGSIDTLLAEDVEAVNPIVTTFVMMADSVTIIDPDGTVIAEYDSDEKKLFDNTGHLILSISESDQILNCGGVILGWVDEMGNVYGNDSNLLAMAPGIDTFKIGYFLFFTNK